MEEMVDIVDEEDAIIGKALRSEVIVKHLIHRTAYVIIQDYFKRLLIQKRSESKKIFPGFWDLGISETLLSGESYETAAIRGLEEELGIQGYTKNELTQLFDLKYRSDSYNTNTRVFKLVYNGPIRIQTDEVDEARHESPSEIMDLIANGVFAPDGAMVFSKYTKIGDTHGRNG